MKKAILLTFFCLVSALLPKYALAQSGYITKIAGNGTAGFGTDGVQATATQIGQVSTVFADGLGNIYFDDSNTTQRIRRINSGGIISTFAGGGSSAADGIPATNASIGFSTLGSINRLLRIYGW